MSLKPIYESPQSIDLSNRSVKGQTAPQGECTGGSYPYYNCNQGPTFTPTCVPGGIVDTSKPTCSIGGYVTAPTCNQGGVAATICFSGAHQQLT